MCKPNITIIAEDVKTITGVMCCIPIALASQSKSTQGVQSQLVKVARLSIALWKNAMTFLKNALSIRYFLINLNKRVIIAKVNGISKSRPIVMFAKTFNSKIGMMEEKAVAIIEKVW